MIKPPKEWTAIEREWWDKWWRDDYSWDGLAEKEWKGWFVGPDGEVRAKDEAPEDWKQANLTHYWIKQGVNPHPDGGDLFACEAPDGKSRYFTRFHLPYFNGKNQPTDKVRWNESERVRFREDLKHTLLDANETEFIESPDRRAQWEGIVAPWVPALGEDDAKQEIHLNASRSHLIIGTTWKSQVFGPFALFDQAHFGGNADFLDAHFGGNANFDHARFGGDALFTDARFGGSVQFSSVQFVGEAKFGDAYFGSHADFPGARFGRAAMFNDAHFGGSAGFEYARFGGNARFDDARFGGAAWFGGAYFLRDANFAGAGPELKTADRVQDLVRERTDDRIAQLKLKGGLNRLSANAFLNADFSNSLFDGDAVFDNRDMLGTFNLSGAQFNGKTSFHGSGFHAGLSITGATFDGVLEITRKLNAKGKLDPLSDEIYAACWTADEDDADGLNKFRQTNEEIRRARFKRLLPSDINLSHEGTRRKFNKRWNDIESAYGTLKQGMETLRRRTDEQDFYTMELRARRRRRGEQKVPYWERMASYVYQGVSNFGGSIARPIACLVAAYFFFAAWYWVSAVAIDRDLRQSIRWELGAPAHSSVEDTFRLSGELIFRPFIIWTPEILRADRDEDGRNNEVVEAILIKPWLPFRVGARLIGTLESVFAIFMLFLTGLALRRRFQIN